MPTTVMVKADNSNARQLPSTELEHYTEQRPADSRCAGHAGVAGAAVSRAAWRDACDALQGVHIVHRNELHDPTNHGKAPEQINLMFRWSSRTLNHFHTRFYPQCRLCWECHLSNWLRTLQVARGTRKTSRLRDFLNTGRLWNDSVGRVATQGVQFESCASVQPVQRPFKP
jgi:hypothetical protein